MTRKGFARFYDEISLQQKLKEFSEKAGQQVVYAVMLLYYILKSPDISLKKKASIAAALGYFIFPLDFIPDLIPIIGFSDDMGVLIFVLMQISSSVTPEIKLQARNKMNEWFKKVDRNKLSGVDTRVMGE